MEDYQILQELGQGSFGAAYMAKHRRTNSTVVIKMLTTNASTRSSIQTEIKLLKQFRHHTNIVGYIDSFYDANQQKYCIVMDYADGGDLDAQIQRKKNTQTSWTEQEIMRMFIQLCLALKSMHAQNVLHRDIKSKNVFLTGQGIIKLGDFGISHSMEHTHDFAKTQIGTPYYLSPEMCENKPYGKKSDVWSLGCVLYEMCTLQVPFQGDSFPIIAHRILTNDPNPIPSRYSTGLQQLVLVLLAKSAKARPGINQILSIPFVQEQIQALVSCTERLSTALSPPKPFPSSEGVAALEVAAAAAAASSTTTAIAIATPAIVAASSTTEAASVAPLVIPAVGTHHDHHLHHLQWKESFAKAREEVQVYSLEQMKQNMAQRMFLENQLAAKRNRERVIGVVDSPQQLRHHYVEQQLKEAWQKDRIYVHDPDPTVHVEGAKKPVQRGICKEAEQARLEYEVIRRQIYLENRELARRIRLKVDAEMNACSSSPSPVESSSESSTRPLLSIDQPKASLLDENLPHEQDQEHFKPSMLKQFQVENNNEMPLVHTEKVEEIQTRNRKPRETTSLLSLEQRNEFSRQARRARRENAERAAQQSQVQENEEEMLREEVKEEDTKENTKEDTKEDTNQREPKQKQGVDPVQSVPGRLSYEELLGKERNRVRHERKLLWKKMQKAADAAAMHQEEEKKRSNGENNKIESNNKIENSSSSNDNQNNQSNHNDKNDSNGGDSKRSSSETSWNSKSLLVLQALEDGKEEEEGGSVIEFIAPIRPPALGSLGKKAQAWEITC